MLGEEDELTTFVGRLADAMKCERVAAYRQLQAISHMTSQLHHKSLDDYDSADVHIDAVGVNEVHTCANDNTC